MNKNICPNCGSEILPPVWNCMKGHVICTRCCKRTSPCPTCTISKVACVYCEELSTDICQHLVSAHNYSGPVHIYNSFYVDLNPNVDDYNFSCLYKRNSEQEEKIYLFDLKIKDGVLAATVKSFNKNKENLRFSVSNKTRDNMIIYITKTSQDDEFIAYLKQIKEHFVYMNSCGNQEFRLDVELGDDFFYI